jgi:D-glycero-alpha-D-manno-heptose-7-phosphate kinase
MTKRFNLKESSTVRGRAPLRLGLAGGGSDVSPYCDNYGGLVLNATIDKCAHAVIEILNNETVEFAATDMQKHWEGRAESVLPTDGDLGLHRAVYNRVIRDFNDGNPISLRLITFCDAPAGSGLGSSSTLVVAMLKAFQELLQIPLSEYETAHLAYEIERIDMQLTGGKQDQYAAAFGGFNFIEFYSHDRVIVNPLRVKNWIISELEASILLCFSGISRQSARIIEEQKHNAAVGVIDAIESMHRVKQEAVVMKDALLRGDFEKIKGSLEKSWLAKKCTANLVTNAHIEGLFDVARAAGASTGKLSGAGGGGFMMILVDPALRMNVARALINKGGIVSNCRFIKHGAKGWRK